MVTDGMNVVKTDRKGRFSLSGFEKTRFISITTPAGFETQQFYLPVKEDRKSYDFIVTESERTKGREHSFIHITDTEVTGGMGRWVTDLQQYIKNEQPAFLIHTGDICYEPGLTMHNQVVNAQTMDCPVYYCIGNHDLVKGNYGEELYESIYGPTWYSFDIGNVHYVVTPIDHGDNPTDYTQRDVYNWLKNDLALMKKDQALVLLTTTCLLPAITSYSRQTKRISSTSVRSTRKHKSTDICTTTTSAIRKAFIPSAPAHWTKEVSITPLLLSET